MAPARKQNIRSRSPLTHIVLVPGFAGFAALGQLEYFARVTLQFGLWKRDGRSQGRNAVLHYFPNFPTAAVATRAQRLRAYLAKRCARGSFFLDDNPIEESDSIALVGHSTGGLDIRRLLWDLAKDYKAKVSYLVDGISSDSHLEVPAENLLRLVDRVVFLSVPQFGTNIADWVLAHAPGRHAVVADLRASIAASQMPVLDRLQNWLTRSVSAASDLDLFYAVQDALSEAEPPSAPDPMRMLMAQEAASELALWMRHIASDFGAINDLSAAVPDGDISSPAHFSAALRKQEMADWIKHGIKTRSYATLGSRPFDFDPGRPAPPWDLLNPCSYPETTPGTSAKAATDIVYRTCYRASAGGPFDYPGVGFPKPFKLADTSGVEHAIARWDNDGIVNTASMLWPNGQDTRLVSADHMDIVGHYQRVRSPDADDGRTYDAYDLLKSGSGFDQAAFWKVWKEVFDFCVGRDARPTHSRSVNTRSRGKVASGRVY